MIGIGVISYNRPAHLNLCLEQISKYTGDHFLYVAKDTTENRKGVAYRSNECMRALSNCDHIFLFNDDAMPIKTGWEKFFIEASKASQQKHFLYLKETSSIKHIEQFDISSKIDISENRNQKFPAIINSFNNCGGCLIYITKEVIEKVGAFDERFGKYGWEHANYSKRIHMAGLTPMGEYLSPEGAGEYIYAMDYDNYLPFNKQVNHRPSLPVKDALAEINKGAEHWQKPITEIFIPL